MSPAWSQLSCMAGKTAQCKQEAACRDSRFMRFRWTNTCLWTAGASLNAVASDPTQADQVTAVCDAGFKGSPVMPWAALSVHYCLCPWHALGLSVSPPTSGTTVEVMASAHQRAGCTLALLLAFAPGGALPLTCTVCSRCTHCSRSHPPCFRCSQSGELFLCQ